MNSQGDAKNQAVSMGPGLPSGYGTPDVGRLREIVGADNVAADPADCYVYGRDASVHRASAQAVVRPMDAAAVQALLRYASAERIPVIPRGSGSGMSGQAVPISGGIVLDMKGMNRILEINLADVYVRVEPGVVDDDLNKALRPHGVFYPPTPASSRIATIGGEIANNASGTRSVKYGATRDSVLGMKVVLASGELVTLGSRTRVEASGYQLARLMVGSEGTLGVIVEATMGFVPIPRFRCMGAACFDRLEEAGETISEIISSGCLPSVLELVDKVAILAANASLGLGLPEVEAMLLYEADGMVKEAVDYEIARMEEICRRHQGFGIKHSYDEKERMQIFYGRKKLFPALSKYKDLLACTSLADDMTVPYSKMADLARKIHEIAERNGLVMTAYGHCGSGCMHTKILMDTSKGEQWAAARRAVEELYEYVRSSGGTTSAEHGIGLSKAPDFKREKADSLELMRAVKRAFDPLNILNPMKLQDAPDDWLTATDLRYRQRDQAEPPR
ncbi:MAG: FAD-linked oxidase C-terminal domain-containing protein [Polyangia bacterium]|jgi:glycolate oxidase|nr:FAD-linked oxidase C-terminal domain-containing protein [Polyangia bacterium]